MSTPQSLEASRFRRMGMNTGHLVEATRHSLLGRSALCAALLISAALQCAGATGCDGTAVPGIGGVPRVWKLSDGGVAAFAKMNVNIDGYARAYHPGNADAGALIHLCNAGRVILPNGVRYEGSESNATCIGRFMTDVSRISQAGWKDASIGAVQWYGILGQESATIGGKKIDAVRPVLQKDGSGFYVSPTSLFDKTVSDQAEQTRYVNPLRIASAVVPRSLMDQGIGMGSFGVAIHSTRRIAVPFVVGDGGPRIGEGSVALARLATGAPVTDAVTRKNRFVGQVDTRDVLWVFFAGPTSSYDRSRESDLTAKAQAAYDSWGGSDRLLNCLGVVPRN